MGDINHLICRTWPSHEFIIESNNPEETYKICEKRYPTGYDLARMKVIIKTKTREEVFQIVRDLVAHKIEIYTLTERKHTIQDLYFKVMGEQT